MTFELNEFIEACKSKSASAVKALVEEALRDPSALKRALDTALSGRDLSKGGLADLICFRSPTLTILKAATPPGFKTPPHNHNMWAVIGTYDGEEVNTFYRRSGVGLERPAERI